MNFIKFLIFSFCSFSFAVEPIFFQHLVTSYEPAPKPFLASPQKQCAAFLATAGLDLAIPDQQFSERLELELALQKELFPHRKSADSQTEYLVDFRIGLASGPIISDAEKKVFVSFQRGDINARIARLTQLNNLLTVLRGTETKGLLRIPRGDFNKLIVTPFLERLESANKESFDKAVSRTGTQKTIPIYAENAGLLAGTVAASSLLLAFNPASPVIPLVSLAAGTLTTLITQASLIHRIPKWTLNPGYDLTALLQKVVEHSGFSGYLAFSSQGKRIDIFLGPTHVEIFVW